MIAFAVALGLVGALLQAAVMPAFFLDTWAAPVPAIAVVAAWGAARRPEETWSIALAAALALGVVSVERAGWFLLALLPAVATAMLLAGVSPRNEGLSARLGRAIATSAVGTLGYAALLAVASDSRAQVLQEAPNLAIAATGTALLAAVVVVLAAPFRPRPARLYA